MTTDDARAHGSEPTKGIDQRLWVTRSGAGTGGPVVLVHGTLDRSAGLAKLARRLRDDFEVIRYDRRGYGRSRNLPGFRVADSVADLVAIIDEISDDRDEPVHLFGHSFGGNVALGAAQARPRSVADVAVFEAPLSWRDAWFGSSGSSDPRSWVGDPAAAAERFMRRLMSDTGWERLSPSTRQTRRAEGTTMVHELIDLRYGDAPWEADRIAQPVLAMYGAHASAHHRRAMETIARELPNATLVRVEGADHFGPNAAAEAVASVLVDFFGESFATRDRSRP